MKTVKYLWKSFIDTFWIVLLGVRVAESSKTRVRFGSSKFLTTLHGSCLSSRWSRVFLKKAETGVRVTAYIDVLSRSRGHSEYTTNGTSPCGIGSLSTRGNPSRTRPSDLMAHIPGGHVRLVHLQRAHKQTPPPRRQQQLQQRFSIKNLITIFYPA